MKLFRKSVSVFICIAVIASVFTFSAINASANDAVTYTGSDTYFYKWSNHWYSKTEGWFTGAINNGGVTPATDSKTGTVTYDIKDVKSAQINTNWSLDSSATLKSNAQKAVDAAKQGSGKLVFAVTLNTCKNPSGGDTGLYIKNNINGKWSGDSDFYIAAGQTKNIIVDVSGVTTVANNFGMMMMNYSSYFSEVNLTLSPISVAVTEGGSVVNPTTATTVPTTQPTTQPDETAVIYGDANGDGVLNSKDVLIIRKYLASMPVEIDMEAADAAYDGVINTKDLLALRKKLAGFTIVLGPSFAETTYTIEELSSAMRTVGRGFVDSDKLKMNMTASGFEFTAKCKGDIKLDLSWNGNSGLLGYVVDGDFANQKAIDVTSGNSVVTLPTNLAAGKHTIRIVKLNEFNRNYIVVKKVTVNGTKGDKPADKTLKLEFYGDSITAGYGNLSEDRTSPYGTPGKSFDQLQNGYKTYAAYCANALGADLSVVAWSGCGINYAYDGNQSQIMDNVWDDSLKYGGETVKWDYTSYDADVVVVNLGTNDCSYANNKKVSISAEEIKTGCMRIINNIRSKNADCKIVWIGGMNGKIGNTYCDVDAVMKEIAAADASIWYKGDFYTSQGGGDWHPNVSDHQTAGAKLATYLTDTVMK